MAYTGEVHSSRYGDILEVVKQVLTGSISGDKIYIEIHGDTSEDFDDSYFVEAHRWNEFDEDTEKEKLSKCNCEKCNSDESGCEPEGVQEEAMTEKEKLIYELNNLLNTLSTKMVRDIVALHRELHRKED